MTIVSCHYKTDVKTPQIRYGVIVTIAPRKRDLAVSPLVYPKTHEWHKRAKVSGTSSLGCAALPFLHLTDRGINLFIAHRCISALVLRMTA